MDPIGFALMLVTCFAGDYNCDAKSVDGLVYPSKSACEFELNNQSAYRKREELECVELRRTL